MEQKWFKKLKTYKHGAIFLNDQLSDKQAQKKKGSKGN